MHLIPLDPDSTDGNDADHAVTLTGIDVSGKNREQILRALRLNRQLLHAPQPDAEIDEAAVREKIDDLLDRLNAKE